MNITPLPKKVPLSRTMSLDIGNIHFVGIGGIGMSGIAEILHNLGYSVQGSDIAESANVRRLREMGIEVYIGHEAQNIENAAVVVRSSAVSLANPEIVEARARMIPVVRRAEMLAELMRLKASVAVAGTHGKTTTTSLVGALLEEANMKPTVINGGIINAYGTNAHLGEGEWLVAEADESDGTFLKIPATIGIITNIDPEHLNYWGTFDAMKDGFRTFVENLPFYGLAVLCADNTEVEALRGSITDRRILAYGIESEDVDIRAVNIRHTAEGLLFDVQLSARVTGDKEELWTDIMLSMPGRHNVLNVLSAIAVGWELGVTEQTIRRALGSFSGVKRRFTCTGEVDGIRIIDDYGHHPTEIAATLSAARDVIGDSGGQVIAVVQPHRYSRLEELFPEFCTCFDDAQVIVVSDVYAAGENPISGVDKEALVRGLKERGKKAISLQSPDCLADVVMKYAHSGDMVVCLGAGSVTQWAHALPQQLQEVANKKQQAAG